MADNDDSIKDRAKDADRDDDKKDSRAKKAARAAGRSLNESGQDMIRASADMARPIRSDETPRYIDVPSMKRGGTMRKNGVANLHKGERVKGRKKYRAKRGRS